MNEQELRGVGPGPGRVDLERLRQQAENAGRASSAKVYGDELAALLAVVDAARAIAAHTYNGTYRISGSEADALEAALEPFAPPSRPAGEHVHKVDVKEMTPPFTTLGRVFNEEMQGVERARRVAALGIELLDGDALKPEARPYWRGYTTALEDAGVAQAAPGQAVDAAVSDAVSSEAGGRSASLTDRGDLPHISPTGPAPSRVDQEQARRDAEWWLSTDAAYEDRSRSVSERIARHCLALLAELEQAEQDDEEELEQATAALVRERVATHEQRQRAEQAERLADHHLVERQNADHLREQAEARLARVPALVEAVEHAWETIDRALTEWRQA